jgi:hypothetical protein
MAKKKPIISSLGQWAYPGEVTIIPSSKITMKGVNYPVLGVDDFGNSQVMMPGAEYEFPGNYVTEYPQMGKGGEMIKRKDGSYSKRGLWDNIRANKGSGKKPTKQMLEQERKIKAKMQQGGWLDEYQKGAQYTPAPDNRIYSDNARVVTPPSRQVVTPVKDFLQSIKPKPKSLVSSIPNSVLKTADITTDLMQIGNFIPHPIGQGIGKVGNYLGAGVDAVQSVKSFEEGDNTAGIINAAFAILPTLYSSKYKRPIGFTNSNYSVKKGLEYTHLNYLKASHKLNPLLKAGVIRNRGIATGLAGEILYDLDMPSPNAQTSKKYKDNAQIKPLLVPSKLQEGDWLQQYQKAGQVLPLVTNNPNDPRLKAYNDSLNLYNLSYSQAKNYFHQPNPDKYATYNKKEAVQRMNYDKSTYGGLHNSVDDKAGKKMTAIQKRTGYLPIGERSIGEGSNYIFKKPVQPVLYQKPVYTKLEDRVLPNYNSFEARNARYNDSLELYNFGEKRRAELLKTHGEPWFVEQDQDWLRNGYREEKPYKLKEANKYTTPQNKVTNQRQETSSIDEMTRFRDKKIENDYIVPKKVEVYTLKDKDKNIMGGDTQQVQLYDKPVSPPTPPVVRGKARITKYEDTQTNKGYERLVQLDNGESIYFPNIEDYNDWEKNNDLDWSRAQIKHNVPYTVDKGDPSAITNRIEKARQYKKQTANPKMQQGGWLDKYQTAGEVSSEQNPERMNPIEIQTERKPWYERLPRQIGNKIGLDPYHLDDKDFGSQFRQRVSDATGGADWYKQSNPFMNLALEAINAPQLAATYGVTGKVQTPSEAMDIQNPYGAMAVDMLLDPANLVGAGLTKTGQKLLRNSSEKLSNAINSQIFKNPKLGLFLNDGKVVKSLDNITYNPGLRQENVKSFADYITTGKTKKGDISEIDFFKGLDKGTVSLNNSLKRRVSDLESPEGFNRLVNQEKELLINTGTDPNVAERVAKLNAKARIEELKNTTNINAEAVKYSKNNFLGGLDNEFVKNPSLYNNAYFDKTYNYTLEDKLKNIINNSATVRKSGKTIGQNFSQPKPGGIAMGYNFINNVPIEMHEIAHALQRGRVLPIDDELKQLIPKKNLYGDSEAAYNYFKEGSTGKESSAFANELRESMYQKGFIPDYYSPINEQQVQDAYKYFKRNPMGVYNKENGNYLSNTRIFDFMKPNKRNSKLLTDILNKLPAVAPVGVGLGVGASQLPEQKYGGWLNKYQDGGENLPELNSKIDIANFYKNPLSEKYGIYKDPKDSTYRYYLKSEEPRQSVKEIIASPELYDVDSQKLKEINAKKASLSEIQLSNIKPVSSIILPKQQEKILRDKLIYERNELEQLEKAYPIEQTNQPSNSELLNLIPKIETLKTLPNKQKALKEELYKTIKLNPVQEYYANKMYNEFGKVILTDKATNKTIYGTKKPDGTWDLNDFEVLTGAALDYNDFNTELSLKDLDKAKDKRGTPIGLFTLKADKNIYGYPGFVLDESRRTTPSGALSSIAYHVTYEGHDDNSRGKLYNNNNDLDNYRSYGCINCQRPSLENLLKFAKADDKALIINSKLGFKNNANWIKKNTPNLYDKLLKKEGGQTDWLNKYK